MTPPFSFHCKFIRRLVQLCIFTSLFFVANPDGTRNILKLAERMVVSFCSGVSGSVAHQWTNISGTVADHVRIRSRNNDGDPGRPLGVVLNASTSIWLPITPKRVFELLRSESLRNEVFRVPEIVRSFILTPKRITCVLPSNYTSITSIMFSCGYSHSKLLFIFTC